MSPSCLRLSFGVYLLALSAAAATQNAVTTDPVDVYAGPDDSYPMVAQLDADEPVQVIGCLDDWSWCDVAFGDNRGWLYAPDITFNYEGGYVPFYTYAPSFGVPVEQFTIGDYWDRYYHGRPWYGQREEWEHREPANHRRPPGPPPSAGPPPRSARVERSSHEGQPERPLRLGRAEGSAEPPHREAERRGGEAERHGGARDGAGDAGGVRPPNVRSPDAQRPDGRPPEATPPQPRSAEHERVAPPPHEEHPGRAEPPRQEQQQRALPPRAEGPRHDEPRRGDKPGDRPND
jgi:uncharacterized protein YraI